MMISTLGKLTGPWGLVCGVDIADIAGNQLCAVKGVVPMAFNAGRLNQMIAAGHDYKFRLATNGGQGGAAKFGARLVGYEIIRHPGRLELWMWLIVGKLTVSRA